MIDRTYALLGSMKNKVFYMISACASPDESWCKMMVDSFRNYLACYDETVTEGGYVFGFDANAPGDVKTKESMKQAYAMGDKIV